MSEQNIHQPEQETVSVPAGKHVATTGKSRARRVGLLSGLILLALILILGGYTLYGVLLSDNIYGGVSMGDVSLSGKDRSEARDLLERAYGSAAVNQSLTVSVNEQPFPITAEEAGVTYDIGSSVQYAYSYGRDGSFGQRLGAFWKTKLSPVHLPLSVTVNSDTLKARIAQIAEQVNQPLEESAYRLEGEVLTVDKGQNGMTLDEDALLEKMLDQIGQGDFSDVDVSLTVTTPAILDGAAILAEINTDPVEPTLDLKSDPSGRTVLSGKPGVKVDADALNAALNGTNRVDELSATVTPPKYTDGEYRALLFRDELSSCTTSFNPNNTGRTTNVLLATDFCNGVILLPGQTFSYNDTVGPRTYERGFKDATIYVGDSAEDGVGGGICQVSSTIYYAVLRADLQITERSAHSRMVTYVALGEDATVAWGSKDFRFTNNTGFPIKVVTSHKTSSLSVRLVGTQLQNKQVKIETTVLSKNPFEVVRKLDTTLAPGTEKVKSNGYTGYKTESYRVVYVDGKEVSRTFENKSSYARYDKIILYNNAAATSGSADGVTDGAPQS